MRATSLAAALSGVLLTLSALPAARAGTPEEVRALYERFYTAQNARDLGAVRALLSDAPDLLWVSDGKSFWGADALVERMATFQRFAVWRVTPLLDRARVVEVTPEVAFIHLPLDLAIAEAEGKALPFRWLVSILCRRGPAGWRIAALFTTADNPAPSL